MMKQAQELTSLAIFSASTTWQRQRRPAREITARLKQKAAELLCMHRPLLLSVAATLAISMLFLACSYLFFTQLANYGW